VIYNVITLINTAHIITGTINLLILPIHNLLNTCFFISLYYTLSQVKKFSYVD